MPRLQTPFLVGKKFHSADMSWSLTNGQRFSKKIVE